GDDADFAHGFGGPPGLAFVGADAGFVGAVDHAEALEDGGPDAAFAEVVDAGPGEGSGEGGVVSEDGEFDHSVVVFGADDGVFGVVFVEVDEFIGAVVGADDVEHFGDAVGVGGTRVGGAEECLGDGSGGVDFFVGGDDAGQKLFLFLLGV